MKAGRSLQELAVELERQASSKKDYIADTRNLMMTDSAELELSTYGKLPLTELAHQHVASKVGIPKQYYDKMRADAPQLLAKNVNHWFSEQPERRMIRTLDGKARAFLSDRYRPLDNFDLAEAVLPQLLETQCKVVSCEVTETRMYLKAVTSRITTEIAKGDAVQAGLVISNSEVGAGSLKVEPLVYRLVCTNGMIAADHAMRKYHVGRRSDEEELNARFYSDHTRAVDDRAFWLKVRDTVSGVLSQDGFSQIVDGMKALKDFHIDDKTSDVIQVVHDVTAKLKIRDEEKPSILKHLSAGGDFSGYGVMNAITRTAEDVKDYDRATDFERIGGLLCMWSVADWKSVGMVRA